MIIKHIIGMLLLIAIPISIGIYYAIRSIGWRVALALLGVLLGVLGFFVGIFLLIS